MKPLAWLGEALKKGWALVVLLAVSLWWGLRQRQQRKRAEAQRDLEQGLNVIERERLQAELRIRLNAAKKRAEIERELEAAKQQAEETQDATRASLEQIHQEHAETGHVTQSAQALFEQMHKEGRLP